MLLAGRQVVKGKAVFQKGVPSRLRASEAALQGPHSPQLVSHVDRGPYIPSVK